MKINIRLIIFLTLVCTMLTLSGNSVAWEAMETKQDIQVKAEPYVKENSISMGSDYYVFDLETGEIKKPRASYFIDPDFFPENTDFVFGYNRFSENMPHTFIIQNCWQGAKIAYSEEAFEDVDRKDIPSLSFSKAFMGAPFDKVAVIKTCEGNYYKLGFVSETIKAARFIYEPLILNELKRLLVLPKQKQFTAPGTP